MTSKKIAFVFITAILILYPDRRTLAAKPPTHHSTNGGVLTIRVTVNDTPLTMLVDTGAQRSFIDPKIVSKLRLTRIAEIGITRPYSEASVTEVQVRKFSCASIHIENLPMALMDMDPLSSASGLQLDGILGTDVLKLMPVNLIVSKSSVEPVTLSEVPSNYTVITLQEVDGLFYCSTLVHGTMVHLLLDTGTNLSNISYSAWKRVTVAWEPQHMIRGIRSSVGLDEASLVLVPSFTIADVQLHDVAMRVQPPTTAGLYANQNFDGLLGTNVLEPYSVILDLAHNRMLLSPQGKESNNNLLFSTVGIQFAKDTDGAFTVMAVWTPSPAAVAGLQVGDRILEVNGSDGHRMTLGDFSRIIHQRPGTKVEFLIDSHGSVHLAGMKIQCLLCE